MKAAFPREDVRAVLEPLLKDYAPRKVPISEATLLWHDLLLDGEDADEILESIMRRFTTNFSGLNLDEYFPTGIDHMLEYWAGMLFGWRDKTRKKLSVGHLLDVIQQERWFAPPPDGGHQAK
jgi:hypothetical protein